MILKVSGPARTFLSLRENNALVHVNPQHFGHVRTKPACWTDGIGASSTRFRENTIYLPSCIKELFIQRTEKKSQMHLKLLLASKDCDFINIFLWICFPESFLSILHTVRYMFLSPQKHPRNAFIYSKLHLTSSYHQTTPGTLAIEMFPKEILLDLATLLLPYYKANRCLENAPQHLYVIQRVPI